MNSLPDGVWPTMITPFHPDGDIDFGSLKRLVDWYIENGVHGLFAVCLSSEMFFLTLEERIRLAEETVRASEGRIPVICSGHISDTVEEQIEELKQLSQTGVAAVVLVTNRLASEDESDDIFLRNLERVISKISSSVPIGLYECPSPYKRLLSEKVLRWCVRDGNFSFIKDTCRTIELIRKRLQIIKGSSVKLFNANSATLLDSLTEGANGFCGIMANFHPGLYTELFNAVRSDREKARRIQSFLGAMSVFGLQRYPLNAKVYLKKRGVISSSYSRALGTGDMEESEHRQLEQLMVLTDETETRL